MNDGEISGNIVASPPTDGTYGGGVRGGITKTGGIIYGYDGSSKSNVVKGSVEGNNTLSNRGHAVYMSSEKRREITAGPSERLYPNVPGAPGGWN